VVVAIHQLTAAIYLVACLASGVGLALGSARAARLAIGALAAGVLLHTLALSLLHTAKPTPPLTDLASAASFMSWAGTIAYLAMLRRAKVSGLAVLVAPMAFLGVFLAALHLPEAVPATAPGSGSVPQASRCWGWPGSREPSSWPSTAASSDTARCRGADSPRSSRSTGPAPSRSRPASRC